MVARAASPFTPEIEVLNNEGGSQELVWPAEAAVQARAQEQLTDAMAGMVTKGNVEAEQEAARKKEEKRLAQEAQEAEDARKVDPLWLMWQ